MIEIGQFLNFLPPLLDGNIISEKRRYMLVIEIQKENNIIKMLNVSSIKNRNANLWYDYNLEIENYYPLPKPSFVKLNAIYSLEYFEGLEEFISKDGRKLDSKEFEKIIKEKHRIEKEYKIRKIKFTEKEFKRYNELILK